MARDLGVDGGGLPGQIGLEPGPVHAGGVADPADMVVVEPAARLHQSGVEGKIATLAMRSDRGPSGSM